MLPTKVPYGQSYSFNRSHVWMWELDHKKGWALKNWGFQSLVLEKILESPLDSKEIKPVNPKGNQPWIFIARTEAPVFWPSDSKSQLTGKDPDARKDWGQKWVTEERWLDGIIDSMDMSLSKFWETVKDRKAGVLQSLGSQRVRHDWATEQRQGTKEADCWDGMRRGSASTWEGVNSWEGPFLRHCRLKQLSSWRGPWKEWLSSERREYLNALGRK